MVIAKGFRFVVYYSIPFNYHQGRPQSFWKKEVARANYNISLLGKHTSTLSFNMASLIAILDLKGKPLIQRTYRDDVATSNVEKFLPIVFELEEEGQQVTPCFSRDGINYMHIRHSNLYRRSISLAVMGALIHPRNSACVVQEEHQCS